MVAHQDLSSLLGDIWVSPPEGLILLCLGCRAQTYKRHLSISFPKVLLLDQPLPLFPNRESAVGWGADQRLLCPTSALRDRRTKHLSLSNHFILPSAPARRDFCPLFFFFFFFADGESKVGGQQGTEGSLSTSPCQTVPFMTQEPDRRPL